MLDTLESAPCNAGFLCGGQLTEADIRLFVTLVRLMPPTMGCSNVICVSCAVPESGPLSADNAGGTGHPGNGEY
jgi:hypothetical protein